MGEKLLAWSYSKEITALKLPFHRVNLKNFTALCLAGRLAITVSLTAAANRHFTPSTGYKRAFPPPTTGVSRAATTQLETQLSKKKKVEDTTVVA